LAYKKNKSDVKKFEKIVFLKKVRKGYIYFAKKFKWHIIDANQQINLVNQNIINKIKL
jgi:thymidylate kinase